ncbi:Formin-like protein 3 [Amphibalanus amphitrite]|uniref:Formin-like protein 3 n=1 Tax=Amphibalanus amphitrite TaxID=1232801 RepID=A0A6A4WNA8_AMPAM|nr:Formin-like protein 3 [Amphibalanus amphitrite]
MVIIRDITGMDSMMELRPPLYNAEDYIVGLRKFGKKGGTKLYIEGSEVKEKEGKKEKKKKDNKSERSSKQEMSMRQFSNVSELLKKLKQDLKLSFPSFVREFVAEPYDGVTALLDLLKMIQLSQTDYAASMNGTLRSKEHHNFFRRALTDEYDCLLCLKHCLRCEETAGKLVGYSHGLYTVAVCIMSNFSKSRTLALELLTVACETPPRGHEQVLEAASTLRLRFGEPVRFKFLIGMLTSFGVASFQVACLQFLNKLAETAADRKERVHLQAEIEEAGFDVNVIKKFLSSSNNEHAAIRAELERWQRQYTDVEELYQLLQTEREQSSRLRQQKDQLKDDIKRHENTIQTLRLTEARYRSRVEELEKQIDFYKSQLLLTKEECDSLSKRLSRENSPQTAAPPGGRPRYSSLSPRPEDGARVEVSSTASGVSSLSSLSASVQSGGSDVTGSPASVKEGKVEEKEKESSEEDNEKQTVSRSAGDDFEKEKICEETIEVKNDMILFDPHRGSDTLTLPRRKPQEVYENRAFEATPGEGTLKRRSEAAAIQEAMDQLTSVIHNAESTLSLTSGRSSSSAETVRPPPEPAPAPTPPEEPVEQAIIPHRVPQPPARALDSESARSFHFSRPQLRRRETFTDESSRPAPVRRAGSFQLGDPPTLRVSGESVERRVSRRGEPTPSSASRRPPPRSRSRDALDDRFSRRVEEPRWPAERFERSPSGGGAERYHQAAERRMDQWITERGAAATRRGSTPEEPLPDSPPTECPRPQARGFLRRGPRNAGLYSERPVRIPSPDYSSGSTLSTVVRLNISNRIMDMPSAMY